MTVTCSVFRRVFVFTEQSTSDWRMYICIYIVHSTIICQTFVCQTMLSSLYLRSVYTDSRSLDESWLSRWYDPRWFPLIALQSFRFNFRWYLANGFLGDLSPSFHLPALAWCPSPGTGSAWCARNTMTSAQWLFQWLPWFDSV